MGVRIRRSWHIALALLALLVSLSFVGEAQAVPTLSLQLRHTPTTVARNDEQLTYTVEVKNSASSSPSVGDQLVCNGIETEQSKPKNWFPGKPGDPTFPSFAFEWRRNGAPISGAVSQTYTTVAADAGAVIQCMVTGTNNTAGAKYASLPGLRVDPQGDTPPPNPVPGGQTQGASRPTVAGTGTAQRTCSPPTNWLPQPPDPDAPTYEYQWLRSGAVIGGATSSTYTPDIDATGTGSITSGSDEITDAAATTGAFAVGQRISGTGILSGSTITAINGTTLVLSSSATATGTSVAVLTGPDAGVNLQCEVIATNAGGSTVSVSDIGLSSNVGVVTSQVSASAAQAPAVEFANSTNGLPVVLALELPAGEDTRAVTVTSTNQVGKVKWACTSQPPSSSQHATVTCQSLEVAVPQQQFQTIEVAAAFGPDSLSPLVAEATVSGGGAATVSASDETSLEGPIPFGIKSFTTEVADVSGAPYTQAGGHPNYAVSAFSLPTKVNRLGAAVAVEPVRDIITDLPPGFIGNVQASPQRCDSPEAVLENKLADPTCPPASVVGSATAITSVTKFRNLALYSVKPERGAPAQFMFLIPGTGGSTMVSLAPRLRADDGYAISVDAPQIAMSVGVQLIEVRLCGFGANLGEGVSELAGAPEVKGCKAAGEPGAYTTPFLTNPTRCSGGAPATKLTVDTWEHPQVLYSQNAYAGAPSGGGPDPSSSFVTGCERVPFGPTVGIRPTSTRADSPTGLDVSISVPTEGLESPNGISQSALKKAVVTLPQGMAVNPSAADGLGACALSQIKLGTNEPVQCPESAKVGSAEVVTPLLAEHLNGNVYLARQGDNPFHSLLALYLVVESKERGILVKIPGKVEADPQSGRLVATFDDNPQVPFSSLKLHFNEGNRAPLLNPPACGSYGIVSQLSPWSAPDQARSTTSTFQITEGPNGGACPNGGLAPKLEAGLQNPVAGTTSPFTLRLSREDGTQRFRALGVAMPPGLTAYLKGVPYCPDSALASVSEAEGTGQGEIEHPSCPAASQIGTVSVGAGGGSNPFYVNTGRAYLAGPYKGAPLSIAIVTPAVAGPFDLGSVVVRSAVHVDIQTARITVDSDPIPTILHGIPLDVRDIRVNVDRPHFTLAPTSCEATAVGATVTGEGGATATPSNRFQVGDCASLAFKPKLKIQLKGATGQAAHPALKAVVTYPKQGTYANIGRAQVNLPHAEFLDQGNLNKTCTRPVLLAGACPKSSVYGRAKAWTPLLDQPLEGNVYLVGGYGYKLPALVADLRGQIRITLVGKVDSGKNHGIRNTFEVVPDAPVSRFELRMKGGKKYGLLQNSEDLCEAKKSKRRAIVRFTGQNGKVRQWKPVVANECGKKHKKSKKRKGHGAKGGAAAKKAKKN